MEHVSFRALARGIPHWELLSRDSEEHVSFEALALGLPHRERPLSASSSRLFSFPHLTFDSLGPPQGEARRKDPGNFENHAQILANNEHANRFEDFESSPRFFRGQGQKKRRNDHRRTRLLAHR